MSNEYLVKITLPYLKFWDMIKRYDPDNELKHIFPPQVPIEVMKKLSKATKIREYFTKNLHVAEEKKKKLMILF